MTQEEKQKHIRKDILLEWASKENLKFNHIGNEQDDDFARGIAAGLGYLISFLSTLESEKPTTNNLCDGCAMFLSGKCERPNGECDREVQNSTEWSKWDETVYESIQSILFSDARFVEERKWFVKIKSRIESEKPIEGLEEEISRYLRVECSSDDEPSISEVARHFAQWGAEHLKKEE